ncbi:family 16 glycosylhydrolase [Salinimicrobium catena]|uniref:family 16 glycosylhydrolase n=1 Tax=Salinimicrobium catena TaxID=390640 RepID=UPI002FE47039
MKNILKIKNTITLLFLSMLAVSCVDDDFNIGEIINPSNFNVSTQVVGQTEEMPYGDGSGAVDFSVSADDAMTYKFIYGDGFEEVSYDGTTTHFFNRNGINDYTVTIVAYGAGGASANTTVTVTVFSDFSDPETTQLLTGGGTKTWYIAAAQPGHLGVGPAPSTENGWNVPGFWYAAAPYEKAGSEVSSCFYEDEMTFSLTQDGDILYDYDNKGFTFFNNAYDPNFGGTDESQDECLPYDSSGTMTVSLSPATSGFPESTGTVMNISDDGFISYYIGASSYEILSITENTMVLRAIQGNNDFLAWYLILTTSPEGIEPEESAEFESQFSTLLWEDNFDSGSLDTSIWNIETGNGIDGWGNQEAQYYTADNVAVADGNLVITAKAETINEFDYTSARITTKDNFDFTYGRVEVRAQLPSGGGVWPAIWMLGADFDTAGWPEAGEIDIMEYKGNEPNVIHGSLHFPGNSGGNAVTETTTVQGVETDFHLYSVEWTEDKIYFLVDNQVFHEFDNSPDVPFNKDFFLILNVAMGGTFGGTIDPAFTESAMLVDYVKVFQ